MRCLLALCILLLACSNLALSARILAVLPMPARSHHNMFEAILRTLAEKGHEVVSYTSILSTHNSPVANYTEVLIDTVDTMDKTMSLEMLMKIMNFSPVAAGTMLWTNQTLKIIEQTLQCVKVKKLFKSNEHFDLVILEALFAQEALLGFGHKFKAPVITLQPFGSFSLVSQLSGNPLSLAFIPDYSFSSTNYLSFYERVLSSYSILKTLYIYYQHFLPTQEETVKIAYNDPSMPSVYSMVHNISFFINNAHPTVHYIQPYAPNVLSVGGIHLAKERKPLPKELKRFLDEASNGVIYLSLGSIVPDHLLPREHFDNFLNVFRKMSQRVLWKTRADLVDLPPNVMTIKWAPQQDILAHQNVVLFMTHGGLFSQHEAIAAGVPVVCTPFFGDQPFNARFYESKGVGVILPFNSLSEKTIHAAVSTILEDSRYRDNMQRLSRIYHDRPMKPADSLTYWVEYLLKYKGATHLRPASMQLAWYQCALLDVLAVVLTAAALLITGLWLVVKVVLAFLRGKRTNKVSKGKKIN